MGGGEAVLSSFMQVVFDRAFTAAGRELSLIWRTRQELSKLASSLVTVRSVVEDAEARQSKEAAIRDWLRRLKNAAYDAADVLDQYEAEALRWEMRHSCGRVRGFLLMPLDYSRWTLHRFKVANKIRKVRAQLDGVTREWEHLGVTAGRISQLVITERSVTSSLVDDSFVFGREEDREHIVSLLVSSGRIGENVSVVSVVGMGGLGKTTLAQLVYNDKRVEDFFEMRAWVCVSDSFDLNKVTKEIFESAAEASCVDSTKNTTGFTNLNLVQENLKSVLKGKQFLLVLDDVWNESLDNWQTLLSPLRFGKRGSKVVVTTRSKRVAERADSWQICTLKGLSEEDCWSLFKRSAFVDGSSESFPELQAIGKEIVKKLKGFPLAAKTLGSLLYSKLDENDWHNILRSEIWELAPDKNRILPALRLSYQHLPPHLKQCFAYCSVFHKDYVFVKDDLVRIWMALGYIQPEGRKRLEDIGNDYFDDLSSRSFFQHHGDNFIMHDMFHDLAQSLAVDECCRMEDDNRSDNCKKIRHLSFSCKNTTPTKLETFYKFKNLQTLLLLRGYKSWISKVPSDLFIMLRCLRVLVLQRKNITELPGSIGTLKQLRYLNLSGTSILTLPSSLSKLYNLQFIKLKGCVLLHELPRGITKLINLRNIEASNKLISSINGIGRLIRLQELEEFIVLNEHGHKIGELRDMTELRGKLCILNIENVQDNGEAVKAKLNEKAYLSVLELVWSEGKFESLTDVDHDILDGLQPHANLKELKIKHYGGLKFPSWMGSKLLRNLQIIYLSNCRACISLPPLGQLPCLKFLVIEGIEGVKHIGSEFYGKNDIKFPSLEELLIEDMPCLEEWHSQQEGTVFPRLREILIESCPNLRSLPNLPRNLTRLRVCDVAINYLPRIHGSNRNMEGSMSSLDPLQESPEASPALPSLSLVYISDCPNLESLDKGLLEFHLNSLEELTIRDCEELQFLPTRGFLDFAYLNTLHLYNCPKLASWSKQGILPSSIRDLRVRSCSSLINDLLLPGLQDPLALCHLEITDCVNLISFPEQWMATKLEFLGVFDCLNLRTLPPTLQELSSLKTLIISNCPKVSFLSPGSMLKELHINNCPLLEKRYQKMEGMDWPIIAHVPKMTFNGMEMLSETCNKIKLLPGNNARKL